MSHIWWSGFGEAMGEAFPSSCWKKREKKANSAPEVSSLIRKVTIEAELTLLRSAEALRHSPDNIQQYGSDEFKNFHGLLLRASSWSCHYCAGSLWLFKDPCSTSNKDFCFHWSPDWGWSWIEDRGIQEATYSGAVELWEPNKNKSLPASSAIMRVMTSSPQSVPWVLALKLSAVAKRSLSRCGTSSPDSIELLLGSLWEGDLYGCLSPRRLMQCFSHAVRTIEFFSLEYLLSQASITNRLQSF